MPEERRRRAAVRRALPRRPAARSPAPTRSRSSASATACPRATCPASAASRCSSPRVADKVLSGGHADRPVEAGRAARRSRSSPWSSTPGWDLLAFAQAGVRTSRRATSRSSPSRPAGAGDQQPRRRRARRPGAGARRSSSSASPPRTTPRAEAREAAPAAPEAPAATDDRGAALRRARAQRVGRRRAGRPGARPAHRGSGSSAGRWTTRPTPTSRWSATPRQTTTRPRRSPSSSAGFDGGAGRGRAVRAPAGDARRRRVVEDPGAARAAARPLRLPSRRSRRRAYRASTDLACPEEAP